MRRYKTIVVDPPWSYNEKKRDWKAATDCKFGVSQLTNKGIAQIYDGDMTPDEIGDFDLISRLADPDGCIIFLWTTNRYLFECPYILHKWGFELGEAGRTMCWMKNFGMKGRNAAQAPNNWESNAEYIVVAKRGNIQYKSTKGLKAAFAAPNEGHSIKPALFYRMIRECTHEPRIDVFARRRHLGFDSWGNQVESYPTHDLFGEDYPEVKISKLSTGELHEDYYPER